MADPSQMFNQEVASSYDDRWKTLQPLQHSLHLQISWILKGLPENARILSVGAGTGAEVLSLAKWFPNWCFTLVDPSEPMLHIARDRIKNAGIEDRCSFHVGFLESANDTCTGFDAATAVLVSHFITERSQRVAFFREICRRLKAGASLITADLSSAPQDENTQLMEAWKAMMQFAGATVEQCKAMLEVYKTDVSLFSSELLQSLLCEAGFEHPFPFAQQILIRAHCARRPA